MIPSSVLGEVESEAESCSLCERPDPKGRLFLCLDCKNLKEEDLKVAIEILKNMKIDGEDDVRNAEHRY